MTTAHENDNFQAFTLNFDRPRAMVQDKGGKTRARTVQRA